MKKLDSFSIALSLPIIFMLSFWVLYHVKQPVDQSIFLDHVTEFHTQSSRLQLVYYAGLVVSFSMACLFLLLNPSYDGLNANGASTFAAPFAVMFFLTPFLIGDFSNWFATGFFITLAILVLTIKFSTPVTLRRNSLYYTFIIITLIYLSIFFITPFFTPLVAVNGARFATFDSHYAMTILPGFDLICCEGPGVVERSNYGISMFLLTALSHKMMTIFGTQAAELILSVRIYQVTAALLLVVAVYLLNRKHFLLISAVALAITPSLNTLGEAVYYPNQSGIRYIPFLLGIILMAWEARRQAARTLLLATASALLFIANPETGFAVFCGFSVFLILSKYDPNHPYATTFKTLALFSASTIVIFLFVFELMAKGLYRNTSADLFSFVELFASGYGGLVSKPSVFATLVAFFGVTAIIRGVMRARSGSISSIDAYQSGIGMMILVWLAYYSNRMAEWNLWFHAVLILLLFAPRIDISLLRILSRKFQFGKVYVVLALSMTGGLLFSSADKAFWDSLNYVRLLNSSCPDEPEQVKGFCILGTDGPEILQQLDFLSGLDERRDYLVISLLPTQVRLLGFNEGFPWYEPFGEIPRSRDFDAAIAWIEANGPRYLVTDDPASSIARQMVYRTRHLQRLVDGLTTYGNPRTVSGWVIYERTPR